MSNGCVIPHTPIAVDLWKVRLCPNARVFLLTHLHGDHITGLTSSWNQPIYCSEITGKMLVLKHGIRPDLIRPLQIGCPEIVYLDSEHQEQMTLTALDANHCPGAVMFLMQGYFGTILHTGDFRFQPDMITKKPLAEYSGVLRQGDFRFQPDMITKKPLADFSGKIDQLFLDNTYCAPRFNFPTREDATQQIIDIIEAHPTHDVVLGLRKLGKENLLHTLAVHFEEYVSVPSHMYETLQVLEAPDLFISGSSECRIRVVSFHMVNSKLVQRLNHVRPTIVILPTALYFGMGAKPNYENHEKVFVVPYSDHSSFAELEQFVSFVKPGRIIPVVKGDSRGPGGSSVADRADMKVFQKYVRDGWCNRMQIPRTVMLYMHYGANIPQPKTGQKRKAKQAHKPAPAKKPKRGIVYDSPAKSCIGEQRPEPKENRDLIVEEDNMLAIQHDIAAGRSISTPTTPPKNTSPSVSKVKSPDGPWMKTYADVRRKRRENRHQESRATRNCLEEGLDETIGQPILASSPMELASGRLSAEEKVQNWLSTQDNSFTMSSMPAICSPETASTKATSSKSASRKATSKKAASTKAESSKTASTKPTSKKVASTKAASTKPATTKPASSKAASTKATSTKASPSKSDSGSRRSSKRVAPTHASNVAPLRSLRSRDTSAFLNASKPTSSKAGSSASLETASSKASRRSSKAAVSKASTAHSSKETAALGKKKGDSEIQNVPSLESRRERNLETRQGRRTRKAPPVAVIQRDNDDKDGESGKCIVVGEISKTDKLVSNMQSKTKHPEEKVIKTTAAQLTKHIGEQVTETEEQVIKTKAGQLDTTKHSGDHVTSTETLEKERVEDSDTASEVFAVLASQGFETGHIESGADPALVYESCSNIDDITDSEVEVHSNTGTAEFVYDTDISNAMELCEASEDTARRNTMSFDKQTSSNQQKHTPKATDTQVPVDSGDDSNLSIVCQNDSESSMDVSGDTLIEDGEVRGKSGTESELVDNVEALQTSSQQDSFLSALALRPSSDGNRSEEMQDTSYNSQQSEEHSPAVKVLKPKALKDSNGSKSNAATTETALSQTETDQGLLGSQSQSLLLETVPEDTTPAPAVTRASRKNVQARQVTQTSTSATSMNGRKPSSCVQVKLSKYLKHGADGTNKSPVRNKVPVSDTLSAAFISRYLTDVLKPGQVEEGTSDSDERAQTETPEVIVIEDSQPLADDGDRDADENDPDASRDRTNILNDSASSESCSQQSDLDDMFGRSLAKDKNCTDKHKVIANNAVETVETVEIVETESEESSEPESVPETPAEFAACFDRAFKKRLENVKREYRLKLHGKQGTGGTDGNVVKETELPNLTFSVKSIHAVSNSLRYISKDWILGQK